MFDNHVYLPVRERKLIDFFSIQKKTWMNQLKWCWDKNKEEKNKKGIVYKYLCVNQKATVCYAHHKFVLWEGSR